jgi:isoquinoline 1-oxidoreductase beta subunit
MTGGPAPYPAEQEDHWRVLGESFTDDHLDRVWRDGGDVDAVLGTGDGVIEAEYRSPYVAHAPLEPLNAIVLVEDERRRDLDRAPDPPPVADRGGPHYRSRRRSGHVHNQYIGGSFGQRLEFEHVKQATEIATGLRGTPVKLTYSRGGGFRPGFRPAYRHGADARRGQGRQGRDL